MSAFGENPLFGPLKSFSTHTRRPYDDLYGQAVGVIGGPQRAAEAQVMQGVREQQAGMGAAANRRGFSGGLARAGQMAGAELGSRGYGLAAQLRAADEQARQRDLMAAAQARSGIEQDVMGMERQQRQEEYADSMFQYQQELAKADADEAERMAIATGVANAGSTAAGLVTKSDRRAKRDAYLAGRSDQDALVRSLSAELDREDATNAWRGGRSDGGRGDARAAQLGAELARLDATDEWRGGIVGRRNDARAAQLGAQLGRLDGETMRALEAHRVRDPQAANDARAAQLGAELARLDATGEWRGGRAGDDDRVRSLSAQLDRENDATTRALEGYRYHYRDPSEPGAAPGPQYGIMAQDLEKTPLGRTMVIDTPRGKMIDGRAATGAALGMIGRLGDRITRLEDR